MQAKLFKFIELQLVCLVVILPLWGCVNAKNTNTSNNTSKVENVADCFEDTVTVTVNITGKEYCIPMDDLK